MTSIKSEALLREKPESLKLVNCIRFVCFFSLSHRERERERVQDKEQAIKLKLYLHLSKNNNKSPPKV